MPVPFPGKGLVQMAGFFRVFAAGNKRAGGSLAAGVPDCNTEVCDNSGVMDSVVPEMVRRPRGSQVRSAGPGAS